MRPNRKIFRRVTLFSVMISPTADVVPLVLSAWRFILIECFVRWPIVRRRRTPCESNRLVGSLCPRRIAMMRVQFVRLSCCFDLIQWLFDFEKSRFKNPQRPTNNARFVQFGQHWNHVGFGDVLERCQRHFANVRVHFPNGSVLFVREQLPQHYEHVRWFVPIRFGNDTWIIEHNGGRLFARRRRVMPPTPHRCFWMGR